MKLAVTKKIALAAAAVLVASAPLAAVAAPPKSHAKSHKTDTIKVGKEEYTSGAVAAYAPATRMLKLSAGEEFKLAPSITAANFKNGDKVTVGWTMKNGARIADKVDMK